MAKKRGCPAGYKLLKDGSCYEPKIPNLDKIIGKQQYALIFDGQTRQHHIVGSNYLKAKEEAMKMSKRHRTGVVITKEVAVVRYMKKSGFKKIYRK